MPAPRPAAPARAAVTAVAAALLVAVCACSGPSGPSTGPTTGPPRSGGSAQPLAPQAPSAPSAPSAPGARAPATSGRPASSGPPAATSAGTGTAVDALLATLTRRQQIDQLFVAGVRADDTAAGDATVASGVGGVFLSGRSSAPVGTIAAATARWRAAAPRLRPWVATDFEGGAVQVLSGPGFPRLPRASVQGQLPPAQLEALARSAGTALARAGVDLDLAPVVDAVPAGTEADNAPIGAFGRQYAATPPAAAAAAGRVVEGLGEAGVTATLKHFPGLGRVRANTDTSADVVDATTSADDPQVAAFGQLARGAHHPFVMVSSAVYTRIDPTQPAVFSPAVVDGVLRGDQRDDGVVITDDVGTAKAVAAVDPGQRAVRFLAAGGTLVLTVDPSLVPAMEDAVAARSATDPAFAATVTAAVRTALRAKLDAGLAG